MISVNRTELWGQSVGRYLRSETHIQERRSNRKIALITERIGLNASNRVFLDSQRRSCFSDQECAIAIHIFSKLLASGYA